MRGVSEPSAPPPIEIGPEHAGERKAIRVVNELAFGRTAEADLVEALCEPCTHRVSLVARLGDTVVGHVLFTEVCIEDDREPMVGMALGPMAVLPEFQCRGIGTRLIREGVAELRAGGCPFIAVIGHPEYYPRFGFERASKYGLRCEYAGVPDEAFMILLLEPTLAPALRGATLRFNPAFAPAV
jgi:putative acetyltransferase